MHWGSCSPRRPKAPEEPSFTDLNFVTAAWVWVAFIVTFLILRKVAWPGLANKLEEREIRIAEGLKKAEEAEQRARELADRQEQVLAEARAEAQKLIADARAAADAREERPHATGAEEIGAERERAKKEINLERAKAIDELQAGHGRAHPPGVGPAPQAANSVTRTTSASPGRSSRRSRPGYEERFPGGGPRLRRGPL